MQDKKVKSTKGKLVIASLLIAVSMVGEMYGWVNISNGLPSYIVLGICAALLIISLNVLISNIYVAQMLKDQQINEQMESIAKAEKASYILMKKNFEMMGAKIIEMQNASEIPAEDIINAQKGVAKVIINRNKENADALMNSNDELMEQIHSFEQILKNNNDILLENQRGLSENSDTPADYKDFLLKQQEFMSALKDMEIRLNQAIMQIQQTIANQPVQLTARVDIPPQQIAMPYMQAPIMQVPPMQVPPSIPQQQMPAQQSVQMGEQPGGLQMDNSPVMNNSSLIDNAMSMDNAMPIDGTMPMNDPALMEAENFEASMPEDFSSESIMGEQIEEDNSMSDMLTDLESDGQSDVVSEESNHLVIDEIGMEPAAEAGDILAVDEASNEIAAEEEKPPMPDLSDPNKQLSADEISALFANMGVDESNLSSSSDDSSDITVDEIALDSVAGGDDSLAMGDVSVDSFEEVSLEPEPVAEEKPPMPDLSDPNKQLSADEIAALFANMGVSNEPEPESEPVVEEKPPMPDLSDPNKMLSPDEIAALIANM